MDPHRYNRRSILLEKDNQTKIPAYKKDLGLLVQVSFDITAFTLPAYQRGSLPRPLREVSSRRRLRA